MIEHMKILTIRILSWYTNNCTIIGVKSLLNGHSKNKVYRK